MDQTQRKHHLLAILFMVACATGYLFDVLFMDKHLSASDIFLDKPSWRVELGKIHPHRLILSDSPTAHYPYKREFWDSMRHGYNTQYLPRIFTGKPTSGEGVGILSTSLFQFFMDIPNALDWSTWFRLVLAAVLMYVLLIQLGISPSASTLAALAWAYNTHQIAWLMYPHHLATELWLPLLMGLNLMLLKDRTNLIVSIGLVLAVVFFFTSGYTQIVLYTFIFIGLFNTLYVVIAQRGTMAERIKTWCYVHSIYLIAGLVLLPDALWQAQEIAEGLRSQQTFRYDFRDLDLSVRAMTRLLRDLLPNANEVVRFFMSNYKSPLGQFPFTGDFFNANEVEFQAFFGLIPLYLCLYGILKGLVRRDGFLIVLTITLLLSIALFNGNRTVVGLLNMIPFGGAGTYSRVITLILFMATIFAAFGARFLIEDLRNRHYLFMGVPFLVLLLWLFGAKYKYPDVLILHEFLPWFIYLAGFLGLCFLAAIVRKTAFIMPVAVVLVCAELFFAGYQFNTRLESKYHFPENTVIKKLLAAPGDFRTALLMNNTAYHHNIFTYYGLSTIGGYSTIVPNDYLYFIRKAYKNVQVTLNGIVFLFDGNIDVLRLLNARYIVTNLDIKSDAIKPIYKNEVDTLYEFKDPLERAYCASDQIVNPNSRQIPGQLANLVTRYDRPVIVEKRLVEGYKLTKNCKISDLQAFTAKMKFTVDTDQPTLVFIPINYHQYWRATLDGKDLDIHKADYSFMTVVVPAGSSKVVLQFINTKLTIGAILSIALGLIALFLALRRAPNKVQKLAISLPALLLIAKSLFSVPGIMNSEIPLRLGTQYVQNK